MSTLGKHPNMSNQSPTLFTKTSVSNNLTMYDYKCRAECKADVSVVLASNIGGIYKVVSVVSHHTFLPDVEFTFQSVYSLYDLRKRWLVIESRTEQDLHVMRQTLNLLDKYTGERDSSV